MGKSTSTAAPASKLSRQVAELDRFLTAFRDHAQQSLAALQDAPVHAVLPVPSRAEADAATLRAQVATLQGEVESLREQQGHRTAEPAAVLALRDEVQALRAQQRAAPAAPADATLSARCAALERELADARAEAAAAKSAGSLHKAPAVLPPAPLPASAVEGLSHQIAALRADKEHLEDTVVTMYTELFSDETIKGLASVLRRKEIDLLAAASAPAPGGGRGRGAGAAPRMKQRLDEALTRVDTLERALAAKDEELSAVERHQQDLIKIQKLESQAQLEHFQGAWRSEQAKRKALHQKVLELKGAIRVFCRVRPLNASDADGVSCVAVKSEETLTITTPTQGPAEATAASKGRLQTAPTVQVCAHPSNVARRQSLQPCRFEFDRVFGPDDGQEAVYEDVSDLITSVADGYNVCIMAYGQTGSGKTYTMQGPRDEPGINKRALQELFDVAQARSETHTTSVQASILEIYNDTIFDLLSDSPRDNAARLDIKESNGHIWIPNLALHKVTSAADVEALIRRGDTGRSTFATDMNEHSSRSHLVLSLYVRVDSRLGGETTASKLHLIDLAGSERLSRSNAQGERRKEAQKINTSLSALGEVIQSLKSNDKHVPYRNCRLTRFLSDSLGGKSKTLLVVALSPTKDSAQESRCSCEFAMRAKKVELGRASRQLQTADTAAAVPATTLQPRSVAIASGTAASRARSRAADASKLRSTPVIPADRN